jgi:hypothetical protein
MHIGVVRGEEGRMGTTASQLSRREALRRGAALGAALAVATPAVQSIGRFAAFAQESPPPPAPSIPSHIQLLVEFSSDPTTRGVKYDESEGWSSLLRQGNRCWDPNVTGYEAATSDQVSFLNANTSVLPSPSGYRVVLPDLVTVVAAAASYDGSHCFDTKHPDGPYLEGSTWVFPKPPGGQGNG